MTRQIGGSTGIVGLFGHPVRHTFSPTMHNAAFEALGMDMVYLPFDVRPSDLLRAVAGLAALGIRGVNVTIPHKQAVLPLVDELSEEAALIGSVNTIRVEGGRLSGHNTDAWGFEAALRRACGAGLAGRHLFVMGAGGASRAVCFQAALSGAAGIVIADIDAERARGLAGAVAPRFPACRIEACTSTDPDLRDRLRNADLVVNATPAGMKPDDPLPLEPAWLAPGTFVYDLIYNPLETRFLREARARGLEALNGIGMLVLQGARSFEIFTGVEPPVDVMFRVLEERFSR
jgi:shikimate dehydrogenase